MKTHLTIIFCLLLCVDVFPQSTNLLWEKCRGGSYGDDAYCVIQTTDKCHVLVGNSNSIDGDVTGTHGNGDYWVVKIDSSRNIIWEKSLGGSEQEFATGIIQTRNKGYAISGYTYSDDGDVTQNFGDADYWIVKLDSAGNIEWQKSYGYPNNDWAQSIIETNDGGYAVAGSSFNAPGNHGDRDFWILKLDSTGIIQWQNSYGGAGDEVANSIVQTIDAGYIVAGVSDSTSDEVMGHHGSSSYYDFWVLKLDSTGVIQWGKSLGGSGDDQAYSVIQTFDGGYAVAGITASNDGDVTGTHYVDSFYYHDYWVVKLDTSGSIQWEKALGGFGDDVAYSIIQARDSSYVIAGYTRSNDGDVTGNHGEADYWVVKLDQNGILKWQRTLGGSSFDVASSVIQDADGCFVVAGGSESTDGDVTGHYGTFVNYDYWVVKLSDTIATSIPTNTNDIQVEQVAIYPNPSSNQLTIEPANFQPEWIYIYDMDGKKITNEKFTRQLDISFLAAGLYFIEVKDENTTVRRKFVKL